MLHWCVQFFKLKPILSFEFRLSLFIDYTLFVSILEGTDAHALEKTKYVNSDLHWKNFEDKYHFSSQFTADLIAMNYTDFIITSSFQEIAGR